MAYDSKGSSGKMMKSKSNTHRMPDGKVMTGKTHSKNSTEVKPKKKKLMSVGCLVVKNTLEH